MRRALGILALIGFGYVLGASRPFATPGARAQQLLEMPSPDTIGKIKVANDAIISAAADLQTENRHRTATSTTNPFGVMVGGIDAVEDLRTGRGVDPYTFAALHAGLATDEVALDIAFVDGKLTYKDRVVTMYSIDRLKKLFAKHQRILDTR